MLFKTYQEFLEYKDFHYKQDEWIMIYDFECIVPVIQDTLRKFNYVYLVENGKIQKEYHFGIHNILDTIITHNSYPEYSINSILPEEDFVAFNVDCEYFMFIYEEWLEFINLRVEEFKGLPEVWFEEKENIKFNYVYRLNEKILDEIKDTLFSYYSDEKKHLKNISKKPPTSCSIQVSMLNQMGVLDLPIFQNKNQAQKERILSKLLNRGIRDIRGNLNSLNPNSNEDLTKYTAGSEGTQAKARDILNQL